MRIVDRSSRSSSPTGFTLIEIIVVIVILGLLVGLVGPEIVGRVGQSRNEAARAQLGMLGTALDLYRLDNGTYPMTQQGLAALWQRPTSPPEPPNWRGPYTRKPIPLDPWGQPYIYRYPGTQNPVRFELASLGADAQPGGEGDAADLTIWEE